MGNFREDIKVENQNSNDIAKQTEIAFNKQKLLLSDPEYKSRVNNSLIDLVKLFYERYPNTTLDTPIARGKSLRSLKNKISKEEIERLSLLYAIRNLTQEEKDAFVKLMKEKAGEKAFDEDIDRVMNEEVTDTKLIDSIMKKDGLNGYVRMALLRITRVKISREMEDLDKRETLIEDLDEKYGQKAAEKTGRLANNLMHWENVRKAMTSEIERKKINDPKAYLKAKDLRGCRLVISYVPDDLETDNEELQKLLEKRKNASKEEKTKYNDECCKALEKDFCNFLVENPEILEDMNLKLVYRKEKNKQNGYFADHLKFSYLDNEDYTFETQVRSMHVDDISRYDGPAGHIKRDDKDRVFPDTSNKEKFIEQLKEIVPQYYYMTRNNDEYAMRECSLRENMYTYFFGYIDEDSEEYKKGIEYLLELENEKNTDAR
ncbi:MAG: hypothetical protein J6M60_04845 [Clostridia bacterium]|nr:hypothetical protein [Clostridia bacterium]